TGRILSFSSMENLNGGAGNDTFNVSGSQSANLNGNDGDDIFDFADGATLSGTMNGGAHVVGDTLTYAGNPTAVTVNLASLTNIETVIGGNGSDTLVAASGGTTFNVTNSNSGNTASGI